MSSLDELKRKLRCLELQSSSEVVHTAASAASPASATATPVQEEPTEEDCEALRLQLLDTEKREAEWNQPRDDVMIASTRLRELLQKCNVDTSVMLHFDLATADEVRDELLETSPLQLWMPAGENMEAFHRRANALRLQHTHRALQYALAIQTSKRQSVRRLKGLLQRLQADAAEARGALSLMDDVMSLVALCEAKLIVARAAEQHTANIWQAAESVSAGPAARHSARYTEAGIVALEKAVDAIVRRSAAAQSSSHAWRDLVECQAGWAGIRDAATALLKDLTHFDDGRLRRRQSAERRHDDAMRIAAEHDLDSVTLLR